jgi:hypothetical protein
MCAYQRNAQPQEAATAAPASGANADLLNDPDYISSVLMSLPGVDPSDPSIQVGVTTRNYPISLFVLKDLIFCD